MNVRLHDGLAHVQVNAWHLFTSIEKKIMTPVFIERLSSDRIHTHVANVAIP
jgi:hypothetical protein